MLVNEWTALYSRSEAVFPTKSVKERKYWPTVRRINEVHGDRNLIVLVPLLRNTKKKRAN